MHLRIRFIPKLTAFFAGGFAAIVIFSILVIPSATNIATNFTAIYGQALASQASKQAVDATFNHDLVRLQVILQDVMENPYTIIATIHDVENNLLVQAGDSRTGLQNSVIFTSPIVLHDSVAGYVGVTLDKQPWSLSSLITLIFAIAALLLCLSVWSMFHSTAIDWRNTVGESEDDQVDMNEEDTTSSAESEEKVFSVIHIKNLGVLKQQLNGQNFREAISRLESIIADVMALYGGRHFQLIDNYYLLEFGVQNERGEALFHATCSAFLILELAGIINKIPLDLAALVSANEMDIVPEKLPFAGLILEATAGNETLITRRINFMELGTEDGRRVVSGFHQPFHTLLENQRKQLSQIL